jgi:flap endonuclease-1
MGVDLGPLVRKRVKISIDELNGRVVAIDGYNALYQFLSIIRGEGGDLLMDSHGNITSHLSGLFYRTVNMLEKGVKPLYIFDGRSPELKRKEIMRREEIKRNAEEQYEAAVVRGDKEAARRYASMSARLNAAMVQDAKSLLTSMGLPWVQAPSEGEAEASYLTSRGIAWTTVSQDYDSLLFGSPRLVRNLTISGRRRLPGKNIYIDVSPEIILLEDVLSSLSLNRAELVDLGILLGTDFNPDGFKGVGGVTALKYIKKYGRLENISELKEQLAEIDYNAIREIFLRPDVKEIEQPSWGSIDEDRVLRFLCDEHDFSRERVSAALNRLSSAKSEASSTLERWF